MKKHILLVLLIYFIPNKNLAQFVTVDDSYNAIDLVVSKLINSSCATVDNISASGGTFGTNRSYGYFEKGTSNFPFQNGVVLTSSNASRVPGPNNEVLSEGTNAWAGDADLEAAIFSSQTKNATILEFDFTPLQSSIEFRFLFASEEYSGTFPCEFSDGFAFLLKKANTSDPYTNLAVIPGTSIPVSCNTIHNLISGPNGCPASNETYYNGDNPTNAAINFNGQTIPMTATSAVIPNVKYHIKLVIADQSDSLFDSAVFLEGGSFKFGTNLGPDRTLAAGNPVCGNNSLTLDATAPGTNTYKWYKDNVEIVGTNTPTYVATQTGEYKVQVLLSGSTCGSESKIKLEFAPAFNITPKTIKQCDTDLDLITEVNLKLIEPDVISNPSAYNFSYYKTALAANTQDATNLILNPTQYNNSSGNTVYLRVSNSYNCVAIIPINLIISATQLPTGYTKNLYKCDDYIDATNNDYDGFSSFDLTTVTTDLAAILPNATDYTIKYYLSEADFNQETSASGSLEITNLTNFRNTVINTQTLWVKVKSISNNSCFGFGKVVLNVEKLPVANTITTQIDCDDDLTDSFLKHKFDTSLLASTIIKGQPNVVISYYDANNVPIIMTNPYETESKTITARVTNINGNDPKGKCYDETTIEFKVFAQPYINPVTVAASCDNDTNPSTNTYTFNTYLFNSTIYGTQSSSDFVLKYYAEDGTSLPNPLPNPFVTGTQKIKVTLENPLNPSCNATSYIQFEVNPKPILDSNDEFYFCDGVVTPITLDAGLLSGNQIDYNYQWYKDDVMTVGQNAYTQTVSSSGLYKIVVTDKISGCESSRTIKVVYSQKATINSIEVVDLMQNNNNSVTINISGSSDYGFSIDEPDGPFQSSNYFTNIDAGFHTVYVHDYKGCGNATREIAVIGIMPFFTPNGDSYNDYWKIRGVNAAFNKNSSVFIFDRYGKLLRKIEDGNDVGWDGTFNGSPLPSDDYWFDMYLEDGRTLKGHFTLKR